MIKRILVAAGPTRERIDPVRFISNYSTGVFGYEIAKEAKRRGLTVTLISGPTALKAPSGVKFISVESSLDMRRAVLDEFRKADCVVMTAAVADWRPIYSAKRKIKKSPKKTIELIETPDILAELGAKKRNRIAVGFALETENLERNALKKLKDKNLDLIVANRLAGKSNIFGDKAIDVVTVDKFGNKARIHNKSKKELAGMIIDKALKLGAGNRA
ncbi:MAG: phosphopantothenoylcysteine decarboxylase [Candidatus Omnitrophota bacterium]|nr:phosphopantothenoylcysteine decarboxylase [Candidatus Omnitrophota bacterium]